MHSQLYDVIFFLLESVRQEKDQREERTKQEEDDKYKVVSKTFF